MALGRTEKGYGIHAINIDGDIGPWLQVLKLEGLKTLAEKKGRPNLNGAEIELMNLAGPATGLEMMTPAGRSAPTPNFFERGGYWRNTIVRGRATLVRMRQSQGLDLLWNNGLFISNQPLLLAEGAR